MEIPNLPEVCLDECINKSITKVSKANQIGKLINVVGKIVLIVSYQNECSIKIEDHNGHRVTVFCNGEDYLKFARLVDTNKTYLFADKTQNLKCRKRQSDQGITV